MYRLVPLAAVLMLAAAPANGQTAFAAAPAAVEVPTTDDSDARRIVCKKEETIGSRLGAKRVCLTKQEWEDRAKADRDSTENVQRQASVRAGG